MAASDKNIVISPQRGSATLQPSIVFTGDGNDPITLRVLDSTIGTLSFEGSAGQLFGISDVLNTGSIFSANYASGIPAIDVNANGVVSLVPTVGKVGIGTTTPITSLDLRSSSNEAMYIRRSDNASAYGILGVSESNIFRLGSYVTGTGWGDISFNDAIRFTSTGNVGIGTSSPSYKLHVVGDINFTGSLYQNGSVFVPAGGSGTELWAAGTGDNIYRLSGNVGIGTTNPTAKLHLISSSTNSNIFLFQDTFESNVSRYIRSSNRSGNNAPGYSSFGLTIDNETTTSGANEQTTYLQLTTRDPSLNGNHGTTSYITLTTPSSQGSYGTGQFDFYIRNGIQYTIPNDPSVEPLYWMSSLMTIKSDGNIGIGTTNPLSSLHLQGNNYALFGPNSTWGAFLRVGGDGANPPINYASVTTTNGNLHLDSQTSSGIYLNFYRGTDGIWFGNGNTGFVGRWMSSGNLGIGTTNPASRLAVNGYITESTDSGTTYWNVVTQQDVGTSPNQVPLNQYLGQLAFMDDFSPNGLRRDGGSIDDVFVNSSGNVGVGTLLPVTKLQVATASSSGNVSAWDSGQLLISPGGTTTSLGLGFSVNTSDFSTSISSLTPGQNWNALYYRAAAHYFMGNTGSNRVLTIDTSGNVGVGTTNPQSSLDLKVAPAISNISTLGYSANASLNIRIPNAIGNVGQIVFTNDAAVTAGYASIGVIMTSGSGVGLGDIIMSTKPVGTDAVSEERLRITSSGSVGIGTNNPGLKLHVYGTNTVTRLQSTTTYVDINLVNSNSSAGYIQYNNSDFRFFAGSTNVPTLTITGGSPGYVGIGTTAPQKPLEVIVPASDYASVGVAALGETQWCGIHFGYRESNTAYRKSVLAFERTDGAARGKIHILNNNGFNNSSATLADARLTILSDGNIGIGTTNPQAKLDVAGGVLTTSLTVSNGVRAATIGDYSNVNGELPNPAILIGTSGSYPLSFIGDGSNGSTSGGIVASYYSSSSGWRRAIEIFNTTNVTGNLLLMKTGGNVGIGTANPSRKLHVIGTSQFTSNLRIGSVIDTIPYDTLNNGTLSWEGSAGQLFSITNNLTSGSIFSVNDVSGIPSIDVDANGTIELAPFGGNIGVGTTSPTQKLDVNGNIRIRSGLYDSNNSVGTSGYVLTSTGSGVAWAAASGGGGGGDPTVTVSATNLNFKMVFASTTANTTGTYGLLQDSESTFTYNPSTNTLVAGTFSGSGSSLTSLNASNISSGIVSAARLGSGTANSNTYLRGNNTWGSPYSSITEDILPSVNLSFNIGSSNYRWNSLYLSNQIDINGSIIKSPGPKAIEFDGDVVIPDSLVAGSLVIYDNIITPFDSTAQQYSGDKGVLVVDGNLDVEGDWFKVPVVETTSGSVWTTTSNLLYGRYYTAGAGTQTAGLATGGDGGGTGSDYSKSTEEYNGVTWISGGNMLTNRRYHAACGTQSSALVFGGEVTSNNSKLSSAEQYNGATWSSITSMPIAIYTLGGCGTSNAALAIGGRNSSFTILNSTYHWNGFSWYSGGTLLTGRGYLAAAGSESAALATGGYNSGFSTLNSTEEYNGISWNSGGYMIYGRVGHCTVGSQNSAIAFGDSNSYNLVTEEYNGSFWNTGGNLNTSRNSAAACGTQSAGLVAGGWTGVTGYISSTEEYTGLSFTPSSSGELGMIRYNKDTNTYQAHDGTQWRTISLI